MSEENSLERGSVETTTTTFLIRILQRFDVSEVCRRSHAAYRFAKGCQDHRFPSPHRFRHVTMLARALKIGWTLTTTPTNCSTR